MKKTVLMIACALTTTVVSAQDMNSKKGTPILPASGDWSISVSASPFLDYAGNLMNGSNTAFTFGDWESPDVITGKMMKDDNTAYRVGVRLGLGSNTEATGDTASGSLSETKTSGNNISLSGGLQKYRGQGRLKGYYGGEVGLGLSGEKTTYSYNGDAGSNVTEEKEGSTFGLSLRGFIGVEYFFAPKMSISGEYGWGLGLDSTGEGETTYGDGSSSKTGKSSSFVIDTDNVGGAINLNFYF